MRAGELLALLFGCAVLAGCATATNSQLESELGASGFETRVDDRGVTVLVTDVLFDYDSDALTADGDSAVAKIAEIVKRLAPSNRLICEGHTDARGSDAYNFELALRRARRVASGLSGAGIDATQILAQGLGETRPLAQETKPDGSDDPAGRARNRRVEVVVANAE